MTTLSRLFAAALFCLSLPAVAAGPDTVVNSFDAALLNGMKNARRLGPEGRFASLEPVMGENFDLRGMTRDIASLQWNRLADAQKDELVTAFSRFETALFADWFDSYAGQTFRITDVVTRNDDIATVGVVLSGAGPSLRLDYVLRAEQPGQWRIVDVRYEGWMSVVERRRGEFAEIIDHHGFKELIARLDSKGREVLAHPDNEASPHLQEPLRDMWTIPIVPLP